MNEVWDDWNDNDKIKQETLVISTQVEFLSLKSPLMTQDVSKGIWGKVSLTILTTHDESKDIWWAINYFQDSSSV